MSTKWFTLDELAKRIDPSYRMEDETSPFDPALLGEPEDIRFPPEDFRLPTHDEFGTWIGYAGGVLKEKRKRRGKKATKQ